jgi:membrane protein DedA with SNARE-associated domain
MVLTEAISGFTSFLVSTIGAWGYVGIVVLMAIESMFIPLPSELVLPPAGYLVQQGNFSFTLVLLCAVLGSIVGSMLMYYLAYYVGRAAFEKWAEKYGKYVLLNPNSLCKAEEFFKNHGQITIFISRLILGVRHFISLIAGFAKMNLGKFIFYTILGAGIWNCLLLIVGYICGQNKELITKNLHLISWSVLVVCVVIVAAYVILWKRKKNRCDF